MTQLYLAIGHGQEPSGVFDPGACYGQLVEHTLAEQVVAAAAAALHRSGFTDFIVETDSPNHHDPDYRGSVTNANALHAEYVVEVHFNATGSTPYGSGTETLCYADAGETGVFAHRVQTALQHATGLPDRGVKARPDLWLLRGTTGRALIPEVAFVDGDHDYLTAHPPVLTRAGEALAGAFLAQVGHRYTLPGAAGFVVTDENGRQVYRGSSAYLAGVDVGLALHRGAARVTAQRVNG